MLYWLIKERKKMKKIFLILFVMLSFIGITYAENVSYDKSGFALVSSVIAGTAEYRHDNMTREKCPECGKFMLEVNGKKGRMLICQDRECGYRKSLSVITNARCPECHKKLEMRGEGDKRAFYCVCGFREKLSDFEKRKQESGAGKRDIAKYMNSRNNKKPASNPLADQLAKWMEENS